MGKRRRNSAMVTAAACALTGALTASAGAQEWPGWRGPERDGHAASFEAPEHWPRELEQVWRTEVGSGYSSPVADDGRICVHTREGDDEVASCLAADSGKLLWNARYPAPYAKNSYALRHGKGPNATPIIDQGKLYTLGMSGILSSFDVATAKLLWAGDLDLVGVVPPGAECLDLYAQILARDTGASNSVSMSNALRIFFGE